MSFRDSTAGAAVALAVLIGSVLGFGLALRATVQASPLWAAAWYSESLAGLDAWDDSFIAGEVLAQNNTASHLFDSSRFDATTLAVVYLRNWFAGDVRTWTLAAALAGVTGVAFPVWRRLQLREHRRGAMAFLPMDERGRAGRRYSAGLIIECAVAAGAAAGFLAWASIGFLGRQVLCAPTSAAVALAVPLAGGTLLGLALQRRAWTERLEATTALARGWVCPACTYCIVEVAKDSVTVPAPAFCPECGHRPARSATATAPVRGLRRDIRRLAAAIVALLALAVLPLLFSPPFITATAGIPHILAEPTSMLGDGLRLKRSHTQVAALHRQVYRLTLTNGGEWHICVRALSRPSPSGRLRVVLAARYRDQSGTVLLGQCGIAGNPLAAHWLSGVLPAGVDPLMLGGAPRFWPIPDLTLATATRTWIEIPRKQRESFQLIGNAVEYTAAMQDLKPVLDKLEAEPCPGW